MPAFEVQRSIVIEASPQTVFDTVADFGTWTTWSPWLGIDKNAVVTVTDDPRSVHSIYKWEGDLVGIGEIEHLRLLRPERIVDELRFIKPFKSKSTVEFVLEPEGHGTRLTWTMNGSLPWFLFWMRTSMETYVGMDYGRGLKMLREMIQTGKVLSDVETVGIEDIDAMSVWGVRGSGPLDDLGPAMERAFSQAREQLPADAAECDGATLSVYHPGDLKRGRVDFTSGFVVPATAAPPPGLTECRLPAGKSLHVRHRGSYANLGNAWSGAYQYARYKKIKIARRDAYEIYRNDPDQTDPGDLVTDIYLPLR